MQNVTDQRPSWLPTTITQAQYDEYREHRLAAIRALGLNPNVVVLNGTRTVSEGVVEVEFAVPPDDWDGTGLAPVTVDEWRENEVRKGRVTLRVEEAAK